jgi:hypothetical protein
MTRRKTKSATTALTLPAMIAPLELEDLRGEAADVEDGTAGDTDVGSVDVDVDNDDVDVDADNNDVDGDVTTRSGLLNN